MREKPSTEHRATLQKISGLARQTPHFLAKPLHSGVTKVTTPGKSKNNQIAINQHVEHNTRSQVWS
jgi:hypothetical protein